MDKRTPSITADGRYLLLLNLLLFFAVSSSNSHCTNKWCYYKLYPNRKVNSNAFFLYRLVFIKPVLIKLVITSAVSPTPVNMEARVMKCVTSQREDSTAHVQQVLVDSSVKLCPRWNHAETSCCLGKPNPMVSTTLLTKTTFRSHTESGAKKSLFQFSLCVVLI